MPKIPSVKCQIVIVSSYLLHLNTEVSEAPQLNILPALLSCDRRHAVLFDATMTIPIFKFRLWQLNLQRYREEMRVPRVKHRTAISKLLVSDSDMLRQVMRQLSILYL